MPSIIVVLHMFMAQIAPDAVSVEDFCRNYPEKAAHLFDALDLDKPGLEQIKAAATEKDWPRACRVLLEFYRADKWSAKMAVKRKPPTDDHDAAGDAILGDVYTLYDVSSKVPRRPDGGLDWTYNGPTGDKEWGWGLNRQPWIRTLLEAYSKTGNIAYVTALDKLLRDWVAANPYPGVKNSTPQWRGLEVFMRIANTWPPAFFGLQAFPEFSPATRLLMLSSIPDHAHYNRTFHSDHGNWITMELKGLASAATYWPEFKHTDEWFHYAAERLTPELTKQVYPDGAQKELSSSYHRVALHSFEGFSKLAEDTGRTLPAAFAACIENMNNYVAYSMNPVGMGPLNNDSDLDAVANEVIERGESCKRPDWTYVATNGARGVKPDGCPSVVFPWAGHVVMRSGWDADAHWAFFDVGPLGIGHWHLDKLHLSVSAYGRDILVDGGRFTYQAGPWRKYFVGSESHNVILIDGHGQHPYEKEASAPMSGNYAITPQYDFSRGVFDSGYEGVEGTVAHERSVLYVRGGYWLVFDRITTDRPRDITALWHFHPDCTVAAEGLAVASVDEGKGNARVAPGNGIEWKLELVKGREDPAPQGWWSRKYNIKEPNTCAVYTASIKGPVAFAWLIMPAKGMVPKASVTIEQVDETSAAVRVDIPEGPAQKWRIPFKQGDVKVD